MTFVGKVLVVFQLVLSICFMAFAGAVFSAQANWKTKFETEQKAAQKAQSDAKTREENLVKERDAAKLASDTEKTRAEAAEAERNKLQTELTQQKKANQTLETEAGSQRTQAQLAQIESTERLEEAKVQRAENKTLHDSRDELLKKERELRDKLFVADVTIQSMKTKHEATLDRMILLERLLQQNNISIDPKAIVGKEPPPTTVEGKVLSTRKGDRDTTELIEISIGSDDDIRKNHELFVYRVNGETKYLGKIRIVSVTPDKAVGTVIQRAKNGTIQKGDVVASKL